MSTPGFRLDTAADGALAVSGMLTFDTAQAVLHALRERLQASTAKVIDLSAVERSDSAGLACVLAALADASRLGRTLAVRGLPAGMRRLAQVCEVDDLLPEA